MWGRTGKRRIEPFQLFAAFGNAFYDQNLKMPTLLYPPVPPEPDGNINHSKPTPKKPTAVAMATPAKPDTKGASDLADQQRKLGMALSWDLVERFVDAYRSGDIHKLASLFSPEAIDNGKKFKELIPRYEYQFKTFQVQYYKVLDPHITPLPDNQYLVKGTYQMALTVKGGEEAQRLSGPIWWKICTTPQGLRICEVTSSVK